MSLRSSRDALQRKRFGEVPGGWGTWITGAAPGKSLLFAFSGGYFSNMVFEKADWNYKEASVDEAVKAADEKTAQVLNATEANLEAFVRLYMVPGMQHCGGGPGPDAFGQGGAGVKDAQHNIELALEQWVEKGIAPNAIVAAKFEGGDPAKGVKMTRPLCPYPQIAKYKGSGDTNDAGNFVCTSSK